MRVVELANWQAVVVDVLAWLTVQAGAGYLFHRLPARWFDRDTWLTRERAWERGGAVYVERLRVRRWKGWLPEAGDLFAGGFDKGALPAGRRRDLGHLTTYVRETRRGEQAHWAMVLPAPLFVLWNPWYAAVLMPLYAVAVNGPCIVSLRYNRLRIVRLLARAAVRER